MHLEIIMTPQHTLNLVRSYKMTIYKLINFKETNEPCGVIKDNKWQIPFDLANTDYQAYLKWVSEGNKPLPADE